MQYMWGWSGGTYHGKGGHISHEASSLIDLVNAYKQQYFSWLLIKDPVICSLVLNVCPEVLTTLSRLCQTRGSGTAYRHKMFQSKGQPIDVPYLSCNYPNRCRTSCSTRELPDRVVVGFQLYSARTFHVTLSPGIYKGGQGPPSKDNQHLRQYKQPHRTQGITHLAAQTYLNPCVSCTIEFQRN